MKRIVTTFALAMTILLTATAKEKIQATAQEKTPTTATVLENKPEAGTLMLNKDFAPTALEPGEQLYYPVLLHCDTAQITRLFHQWNQYVDQHPQDEAAWRNYYEVYEAYYLRSFNAPGGRTKQELARQTDLQERLARAIPLCPSRSQLSRQAHHLIVIACSLTQIGVCCHCCHIAAIRNPLIANKFCSSGRFAAKK